jgi:queuine tRNA-ribosyltransferase
MSNISFSFSITHQDKSGEARTGTLSTAHSSVETPIFMPVATHAALRGQKTSELEEIGYQIILANTYHLMLRPGVDVFKKFAGIHSFMAWPGSVLTDSGGFQMYSLSKHIEVREEGAILRSYVDGKKVLLTPEVSIQTQTAINSDIMMALDQCIPALSDRSAIQEAQHLTHRWARRSLAARAESTQALFGIVQGGCFLDLRKESAEQITSLPFDGYAIGGVAVGEERSIREDIVEYTAKLLPQNRPRYLMGVGTPIDLLEAVRRGVDMFDCILPTALAGQGTCFTYQGKTNLYRGVYSGSKEPIDTHCRCSTCKRYSRGYLHHLLKAGEHLGYTLIGVHNLTFYYDLMADIRQHINNDSFESFYQDKRQTLGHNEFEFVVSPPVRKSKVSRNEVGNYELFHHDKIISVRHRISGEVMHSVSEPLIEAEKLYIAQSRFRERIIQEPDRPLVIWDVGLGAGTNAMAAIHAYESLAQTTTSLAPLRIISFENDLDSLTLATRNPSLFSHIQHAAPHTLLKKHSWKDKTNNIEWTLLLGDFLSTIENAPYPELIFFDPFSYKTNPEMWTLNTFEKIFAVCRSKQCALFTYSASTAIRAGLLAAGFFVARGVSVGPKESTTVAITQELIKLDSYPLLSQDWLLRWERSDSKFPPFLAAHSMDLFSEKIRSHSQFSKLNTAISD